MTGHYRTDASFSLFQTPTMPLWRAPQKGALGSLLSYWSLPHQNPAVISVPTGAGKSAIATAVPYLLGASRVLVVVPSRDLRKQLADDFRNESVLRSIGARVGKGAPTVLEVTGLVDNWESLRGADVVVGLPQSISPANYETAPPTDLFDLVVIDEAHHAPAATWRAILDHHSTTRSVLLTATPQRRDGQRIPGDIVYHYPLRQALAERIYKEVQPVVVGLEAGASREAVDRAVAEEVTRIMNTAAHSTSALLVRASTIERAHELSSLYAGLGLDLPVLASRGMTIQQREMTKEQLKRGDIRGVTVVDMLGEGFDLPRLRVAAYHDKHKSTVATVQLIGRLARVEADYPQESVIVTPGDVDVYPQLQGVVRRLWAEDADWTLVLPGLIDDEIEAIRADRSYAVQLQEAPPELSVEAIAPSVQAILYEVSEQGWAPKFTSGVVPEELHVGQVVRGATVFYSAVTPGGNSLVVVTSTRERPKWHLAPGLDTDEFAIHLLTWRPAAQTGQVGVLAVNSRDQGVVNVLLEVLDVPESSRPANPQRLQDAFDSLERLSVSNVGVRNTYLGSEGVPSYKMFAGKGVDRGLRDADTGRGALGHAMAQIEGAGGSYTAGVATGKGKMWESRHVKLRHYEEHISDFIDRYWFPPAQPRGRLLPTMSRGMRIDEFPAESLIAAIELDPALYVQGRYIGDVPLADLQLREDPQEQRSPDRLPLAGFSPTDDEIPVWRGWQDKEGHFHDIVPVMVRRGYGSEAVLSELFTSRPPSIYYSDGRTVIGPTLYAPIDVRRELPDIPFTVLDWSNVDITREVETNSLEPETVGDAFKRWLLARPKVHRHRWILNNDGPGEIADYIVLEVSPKPVEVSLTLWHAKAAGGDPSVRVSDVQVVLAQAIKCRRWATDRGLWDELGARLVGNRSPRLRIIEGREGLLRVLCGLVPEHSMYSFAKFVPKVNCTIGIVQPGISFSKLNAQRAANPIPISAQQVSELLTVWHDAVSLTSTLAIVASA
ncbi:DEAD/DEAH box helicase family protein [Mycobacteroides abscessus subsp. abscessus]|nr:DEAD/DEAH box helicase family protein [Mycobacteroides abscessus subsp. abscessus]